MTTLFSTSQPAHKILSIKQVQEFTGLSRSTIYDLLNPKSPRYDATFPQSIQLSQGRVGWVSSEIDAWIESRITLSRSS